MNSFTQRFSMNSFTQGKLCFLCLSLKIPPRHVFVLDPGLITSRNYPAISPLIDGVSMFSLPILLKVRGCCFAVADSIDETTISIETNSVQIAAKRATVSLNSEFPGEWPLTPLFCQHLSPLVGRTCM